MYFDKGNTKIYTLRIESNYYYQTLAQITVNTSRILHSIKTVYFAKIAKR